MAYDGSGNFNLPAGNPVTNGTTADPAVYNTTLSQIASGLTNCITRDGQSTAHTNIPMGGYKLTGLAAGTVYGDSVRFEEFNTYTVRTDGTALISANIPMNSHKFINLAPGIGTGDSMEYSQVNTLVNTSIQNMTPSIAIAGGTADALTGGFTPYVAALTNGMVLMVRAVAANTSTTPTFKADVTLAKTIVKGNNQALLAGDIAGAGYWLHLQYDATFDKWILLNPANPITNDAPIFFSIIGLFS